MEPSLTLLKWQDVKSAVHAINPFLASLFEQIPGVDQFEVMQVRYSFGMHIAKAGEFYVNFHGKNIPFDSADIPKNIRQLFDYFWLGFPLGLVMHNAIEGYHDLEEQTIPAGVLKPGRFLSLMTIFNQEIPAYLIPELFSAVAGCRSLLCLSSLADQTFNKRLSAKLGISEYLCPKQLGEQWHLFKEIAQCNRLDCDWFAELLFFSKPFIQAIHETPAIKSALLEKLWHYTAFNRSQHFYHLIWSHFIDHQLKLSEKNASTVIETAKHIVKLAMPQALFNTGFAPVIDETVGPIQLLMTILIDVYKLRYNFPVFMAIQDTLSTEPLYYSLQCHTFLHSIPLKRNNVHTVMETILIQELIAKFQRYLLSRQGPCNLENSALYQALKSTQFDYYHPQAEDTTLCAQTTRLAAEDARFMFLQKRYYKTSELVFPQYSKFFNGCIRITK